MKKATRARDKYRFGDHRDLIFREYRNRQDSVRLLKLLNIPLTRQAICAFGAWRRSKGLLEKTKFYWGDHPDEAISAYRSGLSLKQCMVLFGENSENEEHFRRWLHKQGVERRGVGRRDEKHGSWRGGVKMSKGYRMVQHPDGSLDKNNRRVYILEHRLVMEQHLGRKLSRHEVVHHKNGDILDNRLENLGLYTTNADHLRDTLKGKIPNWTPEGKARMTGRRKTAPSPLL